MKKYCSLILMLLCFAFVPIRVFAAEESKELGFWFEGQALSNDNLGRFLGHYDHDLASSPVGIFGFYVFAEQDSNGYRQIYAGPTWKPASWITFGVGAGREIMPNSTRYNGFFDAV